MLKGSGSPFPSYQSTESLLLDTIRKAKARVALECLTEIFEGKGEQFRFGLYAQHCGIGDLRKSGKQVLKPVAIQGGRTQVEGSVRNFNGLGNAIRPSVGIHVGKQGLSFVRKSPNTSLASNRAGTGIGDCFLGQGLAFTH